MIRRRQTAMDIITMVASRVVFTFLAVIGFMLYVEYEWMMK